MSHAENKEKKKRAMLDALRKTYGIVAAACQMVGIARATHYRYMNEDEDYRDEYYEIIEARTDFVESKLLDQIDKGNIQGIKYYLSCKARNRGYRAVGYQDEDLPPADLGSGGGVTIIEIPHNDRDDQNLLSSGEKQ